MTSFAMDQPARLNVLTEDYSRIREVRGAETVMPNLVTASAYFLLIHFGVSGQECGTG